MNPMHDAIIFGGGPAGATAALLLARAGWSVVLVERRGFPRRKVCGEYLSGTNLPLFDHLGIGDGFRVLAGPPVTKVALFAGQTITHADLPRPAGGSAEWGRALSREHLDSWLLQQAQKAGAEVRQPYLADALLKEGDIYHCRAREATTGNEISLHAPIVIAAHGSWEPGALPTQEARPATSSSDLLAFKAHFLDASLPAGWMPLLSFPGGYGGMVHCDGGRISLSCCIRRDRLTRIRELYSGHAGEAVLAHLRHSCDGVRWVLASARPENSWLAAGPIRPGVRLTCRGGIFPIGNAAGEAHPVIAEGISMAMQSAWLLCQLLVQWRQKHSLKSDLDRVAQRYAVAWRRAFVPRLNASRFVAEWAMRPLAVATTLPLLWCFPTMLTWFARRSGKASLVVSR